MTMTSTARSTPSASTMPVAGHRGDGPGDQLHVLLLERGIEGGGDDRPLARIRVRRRHRLAQVGTVGELAVDVARGRSCSRVGVGLRAGPVEMSARTGSSPARTAAASAPGRRRHGLANDGALLVGEVALALRHDPSGLALEHVELLHDRLDAPARPGWPTTPYRPRRRPCRSGRAGAPSARCGTRALRSRRARARSGSGAR